VASASRVPVTLTEGSVESTAADISLPGNESGIITVRSCPSCSAQTFYFAKDRVLIVNGKQVDLPQLSAALRMAGNTPVSVHYRRTDATVTRIVLLTALRADSKQ
jgi:hypothetical protein